MSVALRVLYVPNERGDSRQLGIRRALKDLLDAELIAAVSVFSLQLRIEKGADGADARRDLISRAKSFRPDVVVLQHLGGTGVTAEDVARLRPTAATAVIYHEADPYTRLLHPLPREARAAGTAADVVFTVGTGTFTKNFRRAGASDVRWQPSVYTPGIFGVSSERHDPQERPHDVVMIANRNTPRLRGLPNWRQRIAHVEELQNHFGPRFAIFGRGWNGPSARGPINYFEQASAISSGWLTTNWDHFSSEPNYFSDRLPISLATGSIHVTTRHPGFDSMFGPETSHFLKPVNSSAHAIREIEHVLSTTSPAERCVAERDARQFAERKFRQDDRFVEMLNFRDRSVDPEAASAAWRPSGPGLEEI